METFDFEGTNTINPIDTVGGMNLAANLTITDTVVDAVPAPGVQFSLSAQASFPFALGSVSGVGRIEDVTGPGLRVFLGVSRTGITSTPGGFTNTAFIPVPANEAVLRFDLVTTPNRTAFDSGSTPILSVNGSPVAGSVINSGNSISFTISNPASNLNISQLTAGFTCFCAGTRIKTPDGSKNVEDLQSGDRVRLSDGRDAAVRWIGRQNVDTTLSCPPEANPIRITRGALGDGLPQRDLRMSADHALYIDGMLINAGALVNGTTIYQERDVSEDFTYYHIETDAHELILAEGVAAETFVDYTTRDAFENADEAPTRVIPEMPLPRISSARLVPEHVRQRLQPAIAAE